MSSLWGRELGLFLLIILRKGHVSSICVEKASTQLICKYVYPSSIIAYHLIIRITVQTFIHRKPNTPFRMVIPSSIIVVPCLRIQLLSVKPIARAKAALGGFGLCEAFAPGGVVEVLVRIAGAVEQHLVFFSKDYCPINSNHS
jgi:hypothetical protein